MHTHKVVRKHELELEAVEAIWIEVKGGSESLLVCNVYRPPNANAEWMDGVEAMIENALTGGMTVVVLGDLNCDMLQPNSSGRRLQMMMAEYGLTQLIDGPTRVTENSSTA